MATVGSVDFGEYPKGAIALNEGEVAHEIVFVGKGMLRQYYYKNGKDVTEHFSYEGCIVMCIESFLKQVPTKLIVETLEPVVLYMFPRDMLFKLAKENWEINMFYQKILEYSLIVSQIKADSWRFESARERYNLLLETHPEIIKRAPLAHIASYLLMTPETLSRVYFSSLAITTASGMNLRACSTNKSTLLLAVNA